jgi:hypothetical protein
VEDENAEAKSFEVLLQSASLALSCWIFSLISIVTVKAKG